MHTRCSRYRVHPWSTHRTFGNGRITALSHPSVRHAHSTLRSRRSPHTSGRLAERRAEAAHATRPQQPTCPCDHPRTSLHRCHRQNPLPRTHSRGSHQDRTPPYGPCARPRRSRASPCAYYTPSLAPPISPHGPLPQCPHTRPLALLRRRREARGRSCARIPACAAQCRRTWACRRSSCTSRSRRARIHRSCRSAPTVVACCPHYLSSSA